MNESYTAIRSSSGMRSRPSRRGVSLPQTRQLTHLAPINCRLKQTFELDWGATQGQPDAVSKSSVYREYVDMCRREGRPALFTRAVVGKMVKRAFPDVRTKRSGPRHRVTQYY
ncbi:hypothetical protein GR268_45300, partial [Rhizobium leguminosarum]|nr:hypothetical protein [Rhizobium leguminosarum]